MSYIVKQIDPMKVAVLDDKEYAELEKAAELLNQGVREKEFPPTLQAGAFYIMRKCGVTNVRTFDGMRIVALQFSSRKLMIERLRAYGVPPGM